MSRVHRRLIGLALVTVGTLWFLVEWTPEHGEMMVGGLVLAAVGLFVLFRGSGP